MLLPAIARMTPDATIASVTAEGRRLLRPRAGNEQNLDRPNPPRSHGRPVRRLLWVLMAAVSLVSAIAVDEPRTAAAHAGREPSARVRGPPCPRRIARTADPAGRGGRAGPRGRRRRGGAGLRGAVSSGAGPDRAAGRAPPPPDVVRRAGARLCRRPGARCRRPLRDRLCRAGGHRRCTPIVDGRRIRVAAALDGGVETSPERARCRGARAGGRAAGRRRACCCARSSGSCSSIRGSRRAARWPPR